MTGTMILLWLKKYWRWIALGGLVIALAIYLRQDYINDRALNTLIDNMRQTSEAHRKEIKRLEEIRDKKDKMIKEITELYEEKIKTLEKERLKALENVATKTIVIREKIVKDAYSDPNTLTDKVEKVFGIPYYSEGNKN